MKKFKSYKVVFDGLAFRFSYAGEVSFNKPSSSRCVDYATEHGRILIAANNKQIYAGFEHEQCLHPTLAFFTSFEDELPDALELYSSVTPRLYEWFNDHFSAARLCWKCVDHRWRTWDQHVTVAKFRRIGIEDL